MLFIIKLCKFLLILFLLYFFINFGCGKKVKNVTFAVTRHIRSVEFPEGSGMGIFFAIGLPIDIPDKSVSLSFYFEANYKLPNNKTANNFYDYLQDKNFNRKFAYDVIQNKLENAGYPGKKCLLRAICEASIAPLINNGIIGDILHIIFTPSSSYNENLPDDIVNAERKTECANQYCECPISLLDLISHFEDY